MKLLDADELVARVFAKTGLKIDADDPAIHDMLIQQAVMAAVLENFQQQQAEQNRQTTENFQVAFAETAAPVIAATEQLERQKKYLLAEIMQANAADLNQIENKLLGIVGQKMQKKVGQEQQAFLDSLKMLLLNFAVAWLIVWVLVQIALVWWFGH
ncbi:hypothetical protein [Neisseria zoodegmatis]|uniref:Uncharacterized protein n=1 Tax=Neisseria zoodegmatis TaxID=326523 RepID=A0AB38DSI4_9NEIS|nr:hypothetical protein [Neisseria zoodegmatis]OSI10929.1 hypothetical protein BWD10_03180 [Neisseria zoodegmatis]SNU80165.1 Uncharacterised protein [Neisseria zoodegmatis]